MCQTHPLTCDRMATGSSVASDTALDMDDVVPRTEGWSEGAARRDPPRD
jgi:hypothetical protein